ncbi:MAG TPA: pyruvate, phosphate dikinase, partial [Spirochaetia bacterium]|nr:pyruvate, phosphate dikinase [Spirochaetia bacterium]
MGIPVEIEWAFDYSNNVPVLYLLQIKPLMQNVEKKHFHIDAIETETMLVQSEKCMGNGYINTIYDFIYIDPKTFDKSKTQDIALELERYNQLLKDENRHYILLGFGRWGTRDKWLGIPVSYNQISNAKIIIEADLEDFRIDCSLGSHFFHNVIAMNIGYFSVPWNSKHSRVNWDTISALPLYNRGNYVVHVRT